ncbi:MAG: twin-arginine translocase subunit TatC [Actinomycetes bacterium]|nr:MAG: twin-arginine translocase subunit TatC [Actinomycetota bacterium]
MTADQPQSILSHLEELRWRLVKSAAAVVVMALVALFFADQLRGILERPFEIAAPNAKLIVLEVTEQWGVLMRIALYGGFILAAPVVLYQVWAFVVPALTPKEKRWAIPMVSAFAALFLAGVLFGYWLLPRGLDVLLGIFPEIESDLRLASYYSFVLRFLLAFGLAFTYPIFVFGAAAFGALSSATLARGRRWAFVIVVVASALITPTGDPLTLMGMSLPLYAMYEGTYWLIRLILKK